MWSWTVPLAPLAKVRSSRGMGCTPSEYTYRLGRGSSFREPGQAARQGASKGYLHVGVNPSSYTCDIYILLLVSFKPHGVAHGPHAHKQTLNSGEEWAAPPAQAVYPRPPVQRRDTSNSNDIQRQVFITCDDNEMSSRFPNSMLRIRQNLLIRTHLMC